MAVKTKKVDKKENETKKMIDELVSKANTALQKMKSLTQEQVDKIVHDMAIAGLDQHMPLAKLAVEETQRGVYEDKITKNIFATEYIHNNIKYNKTVGIIEENEHDGIVSIAEPVVDVCGITPVTNPTSTTIIKSLISIKTRNPIIFTFHPLSH